MKNRIFYGGVFTHCYQNTVNGYLLFYSFSDYIVFFSIICVCAKRYGIRIVSLCQMADHIHIGLIAKKFSDLSSFWRDVSVAFSKSDSAVCHRKGGLFNIHFGSAPKRNAKLVRTNIIYIGNNPVERHLCNKAIEYRWNYLAYAQSNHPFSEKLVIRRASCQMKKAVREVRAEHNRCKPLTYKLLQRLFSTLSHRERLQLIDFIINTYSVIDYDYAASFFGGCENMIKAMEYNTGSEYDIEEQYVGRSDACYQQITKILTRKLHLNDIHEIFALSESDRTDLMFEIHAETNYDIRQLAKYFRLKIKFE